MTEEEFSALFDGEEQALLGELSDTLKATPGLELDSDFARRTARQAEERFARLSGPTKLAVRLEPILRAPIASRQAFPWTLALLAGTAGAGFLGRESAGSWGIGILILALLCLALGALCLPGLKSPARSRWSAPAGLFQLLPMLCVLATSVFCGGVVSALGLFSINFRSAGWNVVLLGPVAGVAVALLLLSTLKGSWRALAQHSVGRPRWLFPVQTFHAIWLGGLTSLFLNLWNSQAGGWLAWVACLVTGWLVAGVLSVRRPLVEEGRPAVWRALHKSLRSLLIGGLPISAILVGAYQATLTRRVVQPQVAEKIRQEEGAWVAAQQAIPADRNGWIGLETAFLSRDREKPLLAKQLRAGRTLFDQYDPSTAHATAAEVKQARREFLEGLPALKAALAKADFSYIATQGFSAQSRVPNFILCRSVSQGLNALAHEAIDAGRTEEALRDLELNLQWSTCFREGGLISLMIGAAQSSLALEHVERWVFEAHPQRAQLVRLAETLDRSRVAPESLLETMKREIYMCDKAFRELILSSTNGTPLQEFGEDDPAWKVLVRILPRSYWESEHKAYLNLQLSGLDGWKELGRPSTVDSGEYLPFSYAARQMVPNVGRAQAQFLWVSTRFEALRAVVALELFQLDHGAYPEQLNQLVPTYLPRLPKNVVSVNVWERKPALEYRRQGQGYELTSQSPVFKTILLKNRQVFGPDGHYQVDKLNP
ncbi:MAG: hypothetical protein J0I12_30900 [Candidatus Eremiobacteraeota bacterium]|nr:hypothetical protein [Candidatus Eremiobacteraeota bacterium]